MFFGAGEERGTPDWHAWLCLNPMRCKSERCKEPVPITGLDLLASPWRELGGGTAKVLCVLWMVGNAVAAGTEDAARGPFAKQGQLQLPAPRSEMLGW